MLPCFFSGLQVAFIIHLFSVLVVECYNTRSNEWMVCPCLNNEKGSLAGVSLNGKIYAMGGGDGTQTYSEVEMFDPFLGKWICSPSMLHSVCSQPPSCF